MDGYIQSVSVISQGRVNLGEVFVFELTLREIFYIEIYLSVDISVFTEEK